MSVIKAEVRDSRIKIPVNNPFGEEVHRKCKKGDKIQLHLGRWKTNKGEDFEKKGKIDKTLSLKIESGTGMRIVSQSGILTEKLPRSTRNHFPEHAYRDGGIQMKNLLTASYLEVEIYKLIKGDTDKIYVFNDFDELVPKEQLQNANQPEQKSVQTIEAPQPEYISSLSDNLTSNAKQTSSASECAKYLKELRDVLVESELEGETYEDVMDNLDKLIVRVDSEGFADELDETRVRQIEDIAHRIKRMCQRQS